MLFRSDLLDHFGVDSYRYYFLREIAFGQDGNFSWESMVDRHNADLANGLGNLASRVLAMLATSFDGKVPESADGPDGGLPATVADVAARVVGHLRRVELSQGVAAMWEIVDHANRYLVETAPWKLAKEGGRDGELRTILYTAAEALRVLAVLVSPVMPRAAAGLWSQLGVTEPLTDQRLLAAARWGGLAPGTVTTKGEALFPRLES